MGNVGTTATLIFIVVLFMAGLSVIIPEISNNPNLDSDSNELLDDVSDQYVNTFNVNQSATTNPLTANQSSTCLDEDAFFKQSCLDKQDKLDSDDETIRITKVPALFVAMFGVEQESIINLWLIALGTLLTFYLFLQGYKFIRTGEVD